MQRLDRSIVGMSAALCLASLAACSDSDSAPAGNAGTRSNGGASGASGAGTGGTGTGATGAAGGVSGAGGIGNTGGSVGGGGAGAAGGSTGATGGTSGAAGSAGTGGGSDTGGSSGTGGGSDTGGSSGSSGSGGTAGSAGSGGMGGCGTGGNGTWPAADPAARGPFMTVTENNVGPNSSYTMFRPQTLGQSGLRHPVITWGNGTGTMPSTYRTMLTHFASHGFVVIASNSTNVAQGNPPPMLNGVTWVLEQSEVSTSPLYQCIDATKIGATGHSQGAFATMSAGSDPRIATIAPIQGSRSNSGLHGPAVLFCGGMDSTLPCSGHMAAFNSIDNHPVMLANQRSATHTNWIGFGSSLNPYAVAATGWFRVHLMEDAALRSMFYGASCGLCQDTGTWEIQRKMMD